MRFDISSDHHRECRRTIFINFFQDELAPLGVFQPLALLLRNDVAGFSASARRGSNTINSNTAAASWITPPCRHTYSWPTTYRNMTHGWVEMLFLKRLQRNAVRALSARNCKKPKRFRSNATALVQANPLSECFGSPPSTCGMGSSCTVSQRKSGSSHLQPCEQSPCDQR